jgi:hypothetical protein
MDDEGQNHAFPLFREIDIVFGVKYVSKLSNVDVGKNESELDQNDRQMRKVQKIFCLWGNFCSKLAFEKDNLELWFHVVF